MDGSGSFLNLIQYAEANLTTDVQIGPHSSASIEAEGMGELVVRIQEGDLPDGLYDIFLVCQGANPTSLRYNQTLEVFHGFGAAELYLTLGDGRYPDCEVAVTGLNPVKLPPIEITHSSGLGGWEYIDRTISLLETSVVEYKAGNTTGAVELVSVAYNSNFELIESDIVEDDSEAKEQLEERISGKLLLLLQQGAPASEYEEEVASINSDLYAARAIVTPEFSYLFIIVANTIIFGAIVAFRLNRNSPLDV
jgi:hypothetical protein